MALRGHASIQGSTDIPTLFNLLPGYLPMPHADTDRTFSWDHAGRLVGTSSQAEAAELARRPGRLLLCLLISMAVQCLFVGINIAFAEAAHVEAPVAAWFFAWTTAKIIAIAPISLGGLGLREASMAALLVPFGADPAQVVAIGLVWQSVLYASGLIGFLVQLKRPAPAKLTVEHS